MTTSVVAPEPSYTSAISGTPETRPGHNWGHHRGDPAATRLGHRDRRHGGHNHSVTVRHQPVQNPSGGTDFGRTLAR